ncbi:MAG: hypothetical protein B6D39_07110 [Anaerolineae bacterium UTCFX2]|jgi:acylphosphatase|nr:acylphosphatase [Anaerolineae bacterium]MCZ7552879.1 acylphosphatase [Anaerolineales bacterium]OQY91436.1 MAG: hypothetical protein B6D39_07110 [Anaerolineae bacterium UTCFX2]
MNQPDADACLHATVRGRVQGVGFRAFVQQWGVQLRLAGWVRNRWDGTVELMAEGSRENLEKLLNLLKIGPRSSSVQHVDTEWLAPSGEFIGFSVRRTD